MPVKQPAAVGIDVGLNRLATLSTGEGVENQAFLTTALSKLRRANKRLHRRKLGSKNREKARRQVARLHYRITCLRDDVLHKLTTQLAACYGIIGIEHLNLKGLLKNRKLASSFSDAALGTFLSLLTNKVEQRGGQVIRVDRFFPSSKTCIRAMEAQGRKTLVRFIEPSSIIPAGEELGTKMEISADTRVLRRYRVHLVDRVPYRILDSYYLASLLGDLLGKDEGYIPLFKWLRDQTGLRAAKAFEKINVRMPTIEEANLLNISRTQPVVDMDRWIWAHDNTLFEYSHIVANAALHEYTYTYNIDEEAST